MGSVPTLLLAAVLVAGAATPPTDTGDTGTPTDTGTTPPTDTGTAPTDTGDTGTPPVTTDPDADLDSDGDGWTRGDGDCNDDDPTVNPGQVEVCFDRVDNDCNGLFDEGDGTEVCDMRVQQASLRGGGGCTGGAGVGGASWLLLPLLGLGWRRRRTGARR